MTPDLDKLAALAGAATPGPWFHQGTLVHGPDKGGFDIGPVLGWHDWAEPDAAYIAAANPSVVLALIERARALEQAVGGFLWLGNNLHNIARAPTRFRELYEAALVDARAVLADPHDAHDDEAAARWTAARIDGGVGQ